MTGKRTRVSDGAVRAATGTGWEEWFSRLDERDGAERPHREIVELLEELGVERPWWRQQIAVRYEQARGLREVGETADGGFQVGVQRTLSVDRETLWSFLTGPDGRALWLGELPALSFEPGTRYETADGTTGEIRTVAAGERVRLTWQSGGLVDDSTLQVTLSCPRNTEAKTTLRIHHEKLADGEARERMRDHWRAVLSEIEAALGRPVGP